MGVVRCERGDHYVDLDYNVEGMWAKNGDFTCWDHLTDAEQQVAEEGDHNGEFSPAQLATIARIEKEQDERDQDEQN